MGKSRKSHKDNHHHNENNQKHRQNSSNSRSNNQTKNSHQKQHKNRSKNSNQNYNHNGYYNNDRNDNDNLNEESAIVSMDDGSLTYLDWVCTEWSSISRVMFFSLLGMLLGFGVGSGHLTGAYGEPPSPWRIALGNRIRSSMLYDIALAPFDNYPQRHHLHPNDYHYNYDTKRYTYECHQCGEKGNDRGSDKSRFHRMNRNQHDIPQQDRFLSFLSIISRWFTEEDPHPYSIRNLKTNGLGTGVHDSSHPMIFAALRESIIREKGGYVHPDLGILTPAPCGASRGLGMVRNSYQQCQVHCFPGTRSMSQTETDAEGEKKDKNNQNSNYHSNDDDHDRTKRINSSTPPFSPEEVLIKIPLNAQLTRTVALHTLLRRLPDEIRHHLPLEDLGDAVLLALLLAHERGKGRESRYQAYIATLPSFPTCGYIASQRNNAIEVIRAYEEELGFDVSGWPNEIVNARDYAERIAGSLARDYGNYIKVPTGTTAFSLIQWALCVVASRATYGNEIYGSLRLVPIVDLINHDEDAGGMVELKGNERFKNGDFLDAIEDDAGAIVVRSMRYWRPKPLKVGQVSLALIYMYTYLIPFA